MKRLPAFLFAASAAAMAMPAPAAALPRTMEAFEIQMDICGEALEMIVAGASDEEEVDFYRRELDRNGWKEAGDLDDLMLLCAFYKQGWIHASNGG